MTDDWQWFWANEQGRDRILRDEVEGLNARLASADSQTRRLSSQLTSLSGSLESRLNALSRAFDAYVELGDVREHLAAYETQAAVRRDVAGALDALAVGRPVAPVDPRGLDYWLPYAMNATIAIVAGHRDGDTETRARALSPEADLFLVAACGVLGRGDQVADLLPNLLIADGALAATQQQLFEAARQGLYGDVASLLEPILRPAIVAEPTSSWADWVTTAVGSVPSQAIGWIAALIAERPAIDAAETDDPPRAGLQTVITELVGRGMPQEAELLTRARELRARIERPSSGPPPATEEKTVTVLDEVRRAVTTDSTTPELRRALLGWLAEPLSAVVDQLTQEIADEPNASVPVRWGGNEVVVTAGGANPDQVESAITLIREMYQGARQPLLWWTVGAGVAALLALVLAINGSATWAVLFALATAVGVFGAVRQLLQRRQRAVDEAAAVAHFTTEIASATTRAVDTDRTRAELFSRLSAEAAGVQSQLAALEPATQPRG